MTRIAYLILVHKNPRLLARFVRALSDDDSAFYVHIDAKTDAGAFSIVEGPNVFVYRQRRAVFWGEYSQVEATLDLMRWMLESSIQYDYVVFLQGSDYPIRSRSYIHKFFEEHRGAEFMSLVRMPAPGFPMTKISKLRYPSDQPFLRFISRLLAKVGLAYRDYRKKIPGLEPFAGDACWALSYGACCYIKDFVERNPQLETFFRHTFTSDEMFFHTILGNSPFYDRTRPSLLYRDWPEPGNHPNMLNERHLRLFEQQEKVWNEDQYGIGEALFARKFSDDHLDLVDGIDAMIERKELSRVQFHSRLGAKQ
jgi:hypothetical protein